MSEKTGIFYAVGVGPGNPDWLTRQACRVLEACPVIAAPRTASGEMLALDIAKGALDLEDKEILPLDFSMARETEQRLAGYRRAADRIRKELDRGRDVAMVNLGDVSVYATAYYVLEELRRLGYPGKMIPGVTSFCAVAAALGRSLTEPNAPLHIFPAGAGDLVAALDLPGTKVFMKSGRALEKVARALENRGLGDRAAMAADCGLPTQRLFETMEDLPEDLGYFATVIVPEA